MEVRQLAKLRPAAVTQWTKARFNKEANSRWPAKGKANGKWAKAAGKVSQVWCVLSKCAFPIVFLRRETHTQRVGTHNARPLHVYCLV